MFNRGSAATTARCSLLLRPLPNLFPPPSHVHLVAAYKHIITFDHRSHHILPTSRTPVIIVYTSRLPSQKKKVIVIAIHRCFFVRVMKEVVEACRRATSTRAKGASYTASSIMLTARVLEVACEVDARAARRCFTYHGVPQGISAVWMHHDARVHAYAAELFYNWPA